MESNGEFCVVAEDNTDCIMSILSARDINVFEIQPNVYGISNSYCFWDKYIGKYMIFCDECKIWYHIVCLCMMKKTFQAILKKENEEYICQRCHCKPQRYHILFQSQINTAIVSIFYCFIIVSFYCFIIVFWR
eukprot:455950_1